MDAERAELHLRRLAEAELREVTEGYKPPYRLATLPSALGPGGARLTQVAQALVTVGAIESGTAREIVNGLHAALSVRADGARRPGWRQATWTALSSITASTAPPRGPSGGALPRHRVAPAGIMIPIRSGRTSGILYLLAYAHTAAGALFTVAGWMRGPDLLTKPIALTDQVTFTDANGTEYLHRFVGKIGVAETTGLLHLIPEPPAETAWLDVTAGEVTRRVPLNAPAPPVEVTPRHRSAGEQYLHAVAADLLAAVPSFPGQRRSFTAPPDRLAARLGDVIGGLQAAGTLSLLNPLRGQLVTLCESLGLRRHGIDAPAVAELPPQWVSMLSYHLRRKNVAGPPADGAAGTAIAFPPVDSVQISILGLHNGTDGTVLHASAILPDDHPVRQEQSWSGCDPAESLRALPVIWLRDDGGRWHTTRRHKAARDSGAELMLELEMVPPLPRTATIEVVVSGATAEARATLPVHWR